MFTSRRKPKRISREDDEPEQTQVAVEEDNDTGPLVRRPNAVPRNKSKLRMAFNPGESIEEQESEDTGGVKPVRLGPSTATQGLSRLPSDRRDVERPSYNKSYLDELRNSTPTTPKELSIYDSNTTDSETSTAIDVAAKFGTAAITSSSAIPTAAEIKEKKERRARLAKEQGAEDFIPLEDYDSDGEFKPKRMQVGSYLARDPPEKDTRLVRDDEDFAEGFEEFTEDAGKVSMGRKAMQEQARKERQSIREMIEQAEGSDDDESDSETERNHAYEEAQTHHGMDGLVTAKAQRREANRPRQPKETTPIPKLVAGLGRLREAIQHIELERAKIQRRQAEVQKERAEIKASQEHIQRSLSEAGEELEKMQRKQMEEGSTTTVKTLAPPERGLESLGNTSGQTE